jgi:hypothetical protein
MPTKQPRVNVVLERPLYTALLRSAARDGVSLSLKARDLLKAALEIEEDVLLARVAEERDRSLRRRKPLTHSQVWAHLRRSRG